MSRLKISIINRDIVYLLMFFVLFASAHGQKRDKEAFHIAKRHIFLKKRWNGLISMVKKKIYYFQMVCL